MYKLKKLLKKLLPKSLFQFYHWFLAHLASWFYGNPSNKMIMIGVTGTNGKSTITEMIAQLLEKVGETVGFTSTVKFKIADKEWLNKTKMTMTGRFYLQKMLKKMLKAGCKYVVVETSSQGIEQYRHIGINYDIVVFSNLTPEHIEAHGGFENYKKAKGKLFQHLTAKKHKKLFGKKWDKQLVVNLDDDHAEYFANFKADKKWGYCKNIKNKNQGENLVDNIICADNYEINLNGGDFSVQNKKFHINLLGEFNIDNALASITVARALNFKWDNIQQAVKNIKGIAGRMELIKEGQDFSILVDYAPEPASLQKLYQTVKLLPHNRIIHVFGSCGGGRDKARRPILGKISANNADVCIVTNEDPYDENPESIINAVAEGCLKAGKDLNKNLFKIKKREDAIRKALSLAQPNDLLIFTGKGSEQAIMLANGEKKAWDERQVIRQILKEK